MILCLNHNLLSQSYNYPWLDLENTNIDYRICDIPTPEGFERVKYSAGTFQDWLQTLPLKKDELHVKLYNGLLKTNQNAHFKIIDIDVGTRDLQQCADAVIRLYSEYLFSEKKYNEIAFNFTSGDRCEFTKWIEGFRPKVKGNEVKWIKSESINQSYKNFRNYLNTIFTYAGSYSLSKELSSVSDSNDIKVGDIFIQGGFPGHAVIVVDLAIHRKTESKIFMLAQSYMPAQEIHVLINPESKDISPWYELGFSRKLYTPEWTFDWEALKRFNK
jgi:hypothetical protein